MTLFIFGDDVILQGRVFCMWCCTKRVVTPHFSYIEMVQRDPNGLIVSVFKPPDDKINLSPTGIIADVWEFTGALLVHLLI